MSTRRLYFESTYLFESPATILEQAEDEKGSYVVLDQTIFYPQGGGQPSDRGIIKHGVQSLMQMQDKERRRTAAECIVIVKLLRNYREERRNF